MANQLDTNPIHIDDFSGDLTLRDNVANIIGVTFVAASDGDRAVLTDKRDNIVYVSLNGANDTEQQHLKVNVQGLKLDVSLGTYSANAALLVYFK